MDRIVASPIQFRCNNDLISFKEPLKILMLTKNSVVT